jgi:DNA-binding LytR/AlgR family response regulator
MTYRRDLLDTGVVVRQPARLDPRPELSARITPLSQPVRPAREPDVAPDNTTADASGIGSSPEVILVKSGFRHVATRVREILYIESARNYVRIHLESGAVLKSRAQIERLAQHLGNERFLRIHRGRLVNRERIRSVRPLAGGRLQLTLTQGSTIVVARDRRRAVLAEIGSAAERRR